MPTRLWVSRAAAEMLCALARDKRPLETGGLLVGYTSGDAYVVEHVIGPGPQAQHGFCNFTPDDAYQLQELDRLYAESNGVADYLGDWHTHPCVRVHISELDVQCLRSIAKHEPSRCPQPVLLILHVNQKQPLLWDLHAWQLIEDSAVKIEVHEYGG